MGKGVGPAPQPTISDEATSSKIANTNEIDKGFILRDHLLFQTLILVIAPSFVKSDPGQVFAGARVDADDIPNFHE